MLVKMYDIDTDCQTGEVPESEVLEGGMTMQEFAKIQTLSGRYIVMVEGGEVSESNE